MDPSRDPFLRRQILSQQSMALATSLSSGQAFYTLESLEGATSLPFLKPAPPASRESFSPSLPLPLERDALLRLDAQTRALLADRETLDARARLLAAEREALLRNLPGGATALPDQRMYAGGSQTLDARDGLQNLDPRARALLDNGRVVSHGFDARPGAPLSDNRGFSHGLSDNRVFQPGVVNISRVPPVVGGTARGATEHGPLSELLRDRELGVGAHFLPAADPMLGRRDIGRAEVLDVGAQSTRLFANGSREPAAIRSVPPEAIKVKKQAEQKKGFSNSNPLSAAAKIKIPPEQSEGWCAVCKIDCNNIKTLGIHVNGKKHKAAVEQLQGNMVKVEKPSKAVDIPSTRQADKKRASDEKPETSQSAKRLKASTPVGTSNTPTAVATDIQKAKVDSKKDKLTATKVLSNPSHQFCELCNISTTGKTNLESHLKGKRHAARVKELVNPQLVVSGT